MKRSCDNCRAIEGTGYKQKCSLGYSNKVEIVGEFYGRDIHKSRPLEECPKPKNYEQYYYLLNNK